MARIKSLIGIVIVVCSVYVAWQLFPPYYGNFQLQDTIESEARLNSYNLKSEDEIKEIIIKRAKELELPVGAEQLKVIRNGTELSIAADYTVHVDLPIYPIDLHFTPMTKNHKI
jgi:hypothetical protein